MEVGAAIGAISLHKAIGSRTAEPARQAKRKSPLIPVRGLFLFATVRKIAFRRVQELCLTVPYVANETLLWVGILGMLPYIRG